MRRLTGRRTLAIAVLVTAVLAAPCAGAQTATRCGLLVFVDGRVQTVLPITVAQLRLLATRNAETTLNRQGCDLAPTSALVDLAGRKRVRSASVLPRTFLAAAREQLGIGELIVLQLVVEPARLQVLARRVQTDGAVVDGVWLDEEPLDVALRGREPPAESQALQAAVASALARLALPALAAPTPKRTLVLPATNVGCDPGVARTATFCLLSCILSDGETLPIDPSVALADLLAAGYDPEQPPREAYAKLAADFGVGTMLRPQLVAYGQARTRRANRYDDDLPTVGPRSLRNYELNLRLIDLTSGAVIGSASTYHDDAEHAGWFGAVDKTMLVLVLQRSACELWHDLRTARKGS